jgi:hypothetical protein
MVLVDVAPFNSPTLVDDGAMVDGCHLAGAPVAVGSIFELSTERDRSTRVRAG